jgi:catechol 2,3-dioxygenase-like lactoylglutathione lyase family enzyme
MLLYITLGTNDLPRARAFYDAALAPLGMVRSFENESEIGYGENPPPSSGRQRYFYLTKPYLKLPATWGNGTMVAFSAKTRAAVQAFHAAALAHGGTDEGAPGLRPYHAHFYACYVRDPDGNKLSAVCEAPEQITSAD